MDGRKVPLHCYAGGPRQTDSDSRADAIVAAIVASGWSGDPGMVMLPDVAVLVEHYVDDLRDSGLAPERVVIALKDALHRADHRGAIGSPPRSGASDLFYSRIISLGIQRYYVIRQMPMQDVDEGRERVVAATMTRSAALIDHAVAAMELARQLVRRAEAATDTARAVREERLAQKEAAAATLTAWDGLEQSVRTVARALKEIDVGEQETIVRLRALVVVSVERRADMGDWQRIVSSAALWAHDAYHHVA
jgi:hypothetical protein